MKNYNTFKDTRTKHYINLNVYEAAKERIKGAIRQSDDQVVLCSGGKDSTATLYLLEEVYNELNINKKPNVIFIDEEVISPVIVEFVENLRNTGRYNFYWLKLPLKSQIYNTGRTREYIQNDPERPHVREAPPYALTLKDFNLAPDTVLTQYELADLQAGLFKGKVCIFKGIRADESMFRFTQIIRRPENAHMGAHTPKHFECVPIYDWTQRDIFLYFYKSKKPYNPIYNHQMWSNSTLRVATPLHTESKNTYNHLRQIDPEFYEKITEIWPDLLHADRYGEAKRKQGPDFINKYPHTLRGLLKYVDDCYNKNKKQNLDVKKRILWAYKKREKNKQQAGSDAFGGYPLYYLFQLVKRGSLKRNIMPMDRPSRKCYEFEKIPIKTMIKDKNNRGQYYENKRTN